MLSFIREHRHWMLVITLVCAVAVCVADTVTALIDVRLTLSAITARWAATHMIGVFCVGLVFGILFGHLFWFQVIVIQVKE